MTTTLIIIGYLVGCVVAYVVLRKFAKQDIEIYTIEHRWVAIKLSSLSWIMAILISCFLISDYYDNNKHKRASW